MTRFEVLLGVQAVALVGLAGGLVYYLTGTQAETRQIVPSDPADASIDLVEPDEEGVWLPLERVEYVLGPWATASGDMLVSVAAAGSAEAYGFTAQPWRVTIEWREHPFIVCGVYSHLQYGETAEPWRIGYCQGVGADPAAMLVTQVGLFRAKGREQIRLRLGEFFDVEIFQVP